MRNVAQIPPHVAEEFVLHHLRLVGLSATRGDQQGEFDVDGGKARVRLVGPDFSGPASWALSSSGSNALKAVRGGGHPWACLRTFHPACALHDPNVLPIVVDRDGQVLWSWSVEEEGGVLLVGTALARDLALTRQGDPEAAETRSTESLWGFSGERPNYLFERMLDRTRPSDRLADWWIWTVRQALVSLGGVRTRPILPHDAPGAVIVTGDDDQASFEEYRNQAAKLGRLPVTYFLHPLAKLDRAALAELGTNRAVEWELHPDALETPGEYKERFAEQAKWFNDLTGRPARAVRNHGFLNDGYWNHARTWLKHGIVSSSNLPGLDGCVLNGSLLPGRLVLDGSVTSHWSLLTLFGDGVFFVHGWDAEKARGAVRKAAQEIMESGVPGVIVMNLHPANHDTAAGLHEAAHDLVGMGFCAMTLGTAIEWFAARDRGEEPQVEAAVVPPFTQTRFRSSLVESLNSIHAPAQIIKGLAWRARRAMSEAWREK